MMYKQWLAACSLVALLLSTHAADGDTIAASDFRTGLQDWKLEGAGYSSAGLQQEGDAIAGMDDPSNPGKLWYYAAPKQFLGGDKTLAYNGWLTFNLGHYEYESMGEGMMSGYDVYLYAKNKKLTLGLKGVFKMDDNHLSQTYAVRLVEDYSPSDTNTNWELVNVLKPVDGKLYAKPPTKHEFLQCLQSLTGIWIRGSYFKGSEATWIKDVKILQGPLNKGGLDGEVQTLIKGALQSGPAPSPPSTSTSDCCASRTCVSNDKYEISFDRPGCMQAPDMYCCMSGSSMSDDTCSTYSASFENSKAAEIIRGTDYNEGRAYFLPTQVDRCKGEGKGQYGSKFSSCTDGTAGRRASWDTSTKNQNMGLKAIPIAKPFIKDYYVSSVPKICSAATLTVEAHGDLADAKDSIMVYGEDDEYLGTLFAGNLTYMKEGQQPYDPEGPGTECDGVYDPNVPLTDDNARLADPHHPSGNRPQHRGYRGGRNDVVEPGVYGNEDTRCKKWQQGGYVDPSLQTSESTPYQDSIAISQNRMIQYSSDGQIKLTFRSVRDDSAFDTSVFSGTGTGGSTLFCSYGSGATDCGVRCEGCDLDGKVIFRSIKLRFSAGVCYTRKAATDVRAMFEESVHSTQPLRILVSYSVPSGENGAPGGDAAVSVTVGADIFGLDKYISVFDTNLNKIGDLFRKESQHTLRSHMEADFMVSTSSFGATDAPVPFHPTTDCDTTNPITVTDKCTPADNQYKMSKTLVNYTDTLLIPRAKVAEMAKNGVIQFYLGQEQTGNAFSVGSEGSARFSPITLAYPLMHCFQKAIKRGPNFGIYLERPMSYYFKEGGFPMPAGDVSFFIAASWQKHVRYVHRRIGAAITNAGGSAYAYDGMEDGLPAMRVDKDTVGDMGTRWVYENVDGSECCPASHRPDMADGEYIVAAYSNCISDTCYDPNADTTDGCTETTPCATEALSGVTSTTVFALSTTAAPDIDNVYNGMKIWITSGLDTGTPPTANTNPVGCTDGTYALVITGGGCTGVTGTYVVASDVLGTITLTAAGTGCYDLTAVTVTAKESMLGNRHGCTTLATFNSVGVLALHTGAGPAVTSTPLLISTYVGTSREVTLTSALAAAPTTDNQYFISADGVTDWDSRNGLDGGTRFGSVAVKLDSSVPCESRNIQVGTVQIIDGSRIRLDTSASATNDAYNTYYARLGTGSSTESIQISSYEGTIRGTVTGGTSTTVFAIATDGEATDDIYIGVMISVDLDGDDTTGDDVGSGTITAYTGATATVTIDTALARTPTTASTFILYTRMATLASAPTGITFASDFADNTPEVIGGAAAIGATDVTLGATAAATANLYDSMTVVFTHTDGTVQTRKIKSYSVGKVASLDAPLTSDITTATTYLIYRDYEIYYDLGSGCLSNVDMRITYSIGFAKTVSNDPGELLEIYSVWDGKYGRSTTSSSEVVKSWVLKLAGDGYYNNLYTSQGVGSFSETTLTNAVAAADTIITLGSTDGIIPGIYLHITDIDAASPIEEFVLVRGVNNLEVTVTRAQLNSYAVAHAAGVFVRGPAGANDGQGMDEMANFGGINRPSAITDDAYEGLNVTIEYGKGAGQTRGIVSYHAESRTVYIDHAWNVIPDETSRYRIYYTAEVQSFDTTSSIAVVTLPRPVKSGYLYKVFWHACVTDTPTTVGASTISAPRNDGLPQCRGQLGMRIPLQGAATIYSKLAPLHTRYVSGSISASSATDQFTLDDHAETNIDEYVGRKITLSTRLLHYGANRIAVAGGGSGCTTTSGYLIFTGGGGSGAAGTYTAAAGAITSVQLTDGGSFYTSYPTVTVSDTSCTGYTWNWDSGVLTAQNAAVGETRTIIASTSGRVVKVDSAFSAQPDGNMYYRIDPAPGMSKKTTVSNGDVIETYIAREVDVIRQEYPEMVEQHKEWPHGYSYMQLKAGEDGEHLANLFLKDYTQFSTNSYYLDEVTIPKSVFENYIRAQPNGVSGEFPFTIKTPPGRSNIEIHSIVIGYPVANMEDASTIEDETEITTSRVSTHGPPPFFPHTPSWSGADLSDRVAATHPRFRSHHYTSTCGNGEHDAGEYCDDGNEVDGDGCSSACSLEAGWLCETFSLGSPSVCRKGAVGERLPDQEVGCKFYACQSTNLAYLNSGVMCSGTTKDANGDFPVCLDANSVQGTCDLCVTWDRSANGLPDDSATPGFAGAWLRR